MFQNKRIIAALSFIVLASLILAGCSGSANAQTGSTSGGFTGYGKVTQVSYTNTVESTGQIEPQHIASLNFSTSGRVSQSNITVGQTVKAGDMLMTLDLSSVPANLQTAQIDLTNARNELIQLSAPDLSTVTTAGQTLSNAYNSYQQAQAALSNAIITNQTASESKLYDNWLASKNELNTAQNKMPLANASIDIQSYYQAVRDTNTLKEELAAAADNASVHPTDTVLAQKVTALQTAVQNSQTNETSLQAGLSSDVVQLVDALVGDQNAYDQASSAFISAVVTSTASTNSNLAQVEADLTSKQSTLLNAQSTLQDQQNKRAGMNGVRCDQTTINDYQDAYNIALGRYNASAHLTNSAEWNALQTAAANLNFCTSTFSAADIATADAKIASTQAQIQLLQTQIASDQAQITDSGNAVFILAISLNNYWAAYQAADQQLNNAVIALYQLQRAPNPDDLAAAQAKVQSAESEVNSLKISAPFDGLVTSVGYQSGDSVSQGTPAVVLVDRTKLYVDLQIDESHVVELSQGDKATIALEAVANKSLTGSVSYINPVGTSNQGVVYYDVRVVLDQADPSILIGATADVTIQAGQAQNVLTVPVSAVGNDTNGEYVYVIDASGNATQVSVVSGQILPNNTVIVTGNLQPGASVGLLSSTSTGTNNGGFGGGGGGGRFIVP
ncbi:MAG TPA: efflux RND transporter periplasmic adaptor subunit [Anaerolineales bacterium]|nr:efflux RND transporter periplasmic adaptor subunit [Anaerolineales bacterium]